MSTSRGFSLVEVLVATGILALVSLTSAALLTGIVHTQQRATASSNVETEANYALYQMTQSMRNASAITAPAASTTSSSLTLALSGVAADSPTVISLSGTTLMIQKGVGSAIALTSPNVQVSNLIFTNVTASGTKGTIRVSF